MGRGPGRPSKLTPALQKKICEKIARGLTFDQACTLVGITTTTFASWRAKGEKAKTGKYADFLRATKKAEAAFIDHHIAIIHEAANDTWPAGAWLLERKYPDKYSRSEKRIVDHHMPDLVAAIRDIKSNDGTGSEP